MNLNPADVLNPVFNFLDAPDLELRCLSLPRVCLVVPGTIAWVLGGGLRQNRAQGNLPQSFLASSL